MRATRWTRSEPFSTATLARRRSWGASRVSCSRTRVRVHRTVERSRRGSTMTTGKTRRTVEIAEEVPDLQSGHESAAESAAESGARSGAEVESEERIERLRAEL